MEGPSTIERLRQTLELEEASEVLTALPAETYTKLAGYAQKLRATTGSGNDDAPGRLAKKQLYAWLASSNRKVSWTVTWETWSFLTWRWQRGSRR